jgi:hypothetical protein
MLFIISVFYFFQRKYYSLKTYIRWIFFCH